MMKMDGRPSACLAGTTVQEVMGMRTSLLRAPPTPAGRPARASLLTVSLVLLVLLTLLTAACGGPAGEPAATPEPAPSRVEVELYFVNHQLRFSTSGPARSPADALTTMPATSRRVQTSGSGRTAGPVSR
jgi:hypothetical protein